MKSMKEPRDVLILLLAIVLAAGVVLTSLTGLLTPSFYHRETPNWQAQSLGQDMMDLFIVVPVLLVSGFFAWRGRMQARWVWGGTLLYLVYTFCLYGFDVHFNSLFLFYCINLGLSFYGLLYFVYTTRRDIALSWPIRNGLRKTIAIYFILVAVLFYSLWLAEVVPAMIRGIPPQSLRDVGLPTNGVHVIDLAVFLPGLFITGVLFWKKHNLGILLVPLGLTFMVLMDITIGGLMVFMHWKGFPANLAVMYVMFVLAAFTLFLLVRFFTSPEKKPGKDDIAI